MRDYSHKHGVPPIPREHGAGDTGFMGDEPGRAFTEHSTAQLLPQNEVSGVHSALQHLPAVGSSGNS